MLHAVPLALAVTVVSQTPDDLVLCTGASDCPVGAACEDGVCVMVGDVAPPAAAPKVERRRRRRRKRRPTYKNPGECRRHHECGGGQECFKGKCGPEIPSSGLGLTIAGGIVSGTSLFSFIAAPLCKLDGRNFSREAENVCLGVYVGIGVVQLAVGLPMLIVGIVRRSQFKEWVRQYHPRLAVWVEEDQRVATLGFDF